MGRPTTYSFLDLSGAITHPLVGTYPFVGEGVGQIDIVMSTDRSAHDVAADGTIMVSKLAGNNGMVTITCQQTSEIHKFLLRLYNELIVADTSEWAKITMFIRNTTDGSSHLLTGVSFSKKGDKTYQAQGQRVSWSLHAADIESMPMS